MFRFWRLKTNLSVTLAFQVNILWVLYLSAVFFHTGFDRHEGRNIPLTERNYSMLHKWEFGLVCKIIHCITESWNTIAGSNTKIQGFPSRRITSFTPFLWLISLMATREQQLTKRASVQLWSLEKLNVLWNAICTWLNSHSSRSRYFTSKFYGKTIMDSWFKCSLFQNTPCYSQVNFSSVSLSILLWITQSKRHAWVFMLIKLINSALH